MVKSNIPQTERWDQFSQMVQDRLVEPLRLNDIVISVNRQQGENGSVEVSFPRQEPSNFDHEELISLSEDIRPILDDLLQDCDVRHGDITFVVNQGALKETVFSVSKRPEESSREFFKSKKTQEPELDIAGNGTETISPLKRRRSEWTKEKNRRRCELVDKEIDQTLSPSEKLELESLQAEMLAYRRKVAPLPLEDLRELHQELLQKFHQQSE